MLIFLVLVCCRVLAPADGAVVSAVYYFDQSDCLSAPLYVEMRSDVAAVQYCSNASASCKANLACILEPSSCEQPSAVPFRSLLNDTSMRSFLDGRAGTLTLRPFHVCFPSPSYRACHELHVPLPDLAAPSVWSPQAPSSTIVVASLIVAAVGMSITAIVVYSVWRSRRAMQMELIGSAEDVREDVDEQDLDAQQSDEQDLDEQ